MNLKKIGKVLTSKSVGTGPSSYGKRIYLAAVSQRLRHTGSHQHGVDRERSFNLSKEMRSGPGSAVVIATDYGLDSPGSSPGGDEIFRPSRPALGSTQPPVKWVPVLSRR